MKAFILGALFFISYSAHGNDHKARVSAFNECVMHGIQDMDDDESFEDVAKFCVGENNKTFKSSKLKFTVIKNKKTSGMGNIEVEGMRPTLATFDANNLPAASCEMCFQHASSISEGKSTSKEILKTVVVQGAPLPVVKASLGPQPTCENGFTFKNGECEKDCADKTQVMNGFIRRKDEPECISCDDYFEKYKSRMNLKKPKGLHSTPDSNQCVDENGCELHEEWSAQFKKCIKRCKEYEEYDDSFYGCKKKRGGCDAERSELLKIPVQPIPSWVSEFKNLGCNTDRLLKRYLKQYTDFIKSRFESCKKYDEQDPAFENADTSSSDFLSRDYLVQRLYTDCATELDVSRRELERNMSLPTEHYEYYPVKPSEMY